MQRTGLPYPDWRDAATYAALLEADRAGIAWEWLRRDAGYRAAAAAMREHGAAQSPGGERPEHWGLHAFEDSDLSLPRARPLWTAAAHALVLPLDAGPVREPGSGFDLAGLSRFATLLPGFAGGEHLLLSDGLRSIRIDVCCGSLASGETRLRFRLEGPSGVDGPLLVLRRLLALTRSGRFSRELHPPERRARRWILVLRTADALAAGAGQRDIAAALLDRDAAHRGWRAERPSLRLQAQRLVRDARRMAAGGYRELLR